MRGLGVEITKNIVLAGLNKVIIYDPNISKINDSTSNFYLSEEDVESGKRRDETVIAKLSSLNSYVSIEIMKGNNILENLENCLQNDESKYDVVSIIEFLPED